MSNNNPQIDNVEQLELNTAAAGLPEFVDRIVALARAGDEPRVGMFRVPGSDDSLIVDKTGAAETVFPEFDPLVYSVETLAHLPIIVESIVAAGNSAEFLAVVELDSVVLVERPHHSRHPDRIRKVVCPLDQSSEFERLTDGLRNADQSRALSWLRSTLLDCIHDGDILFKALRDLRFRANVETQSSASPSRASYGKEVDLSVHGGSVSLDQWDTFTVELPLLADPGFGKRYPVSCFLEVEHRNQTITIAARHGALESAWSQLRVDVVEHVRELLPSIPVVLGSFDATPRSRAIADQLSKT